MAAGKAALGKTKRAAGLAGNVFSPLFRFEDLGVRGSGRDFGELAALHAVRANFERFRKAANVAGMQKGPRAARGNIKGARQAVLREQFRDAEVEGVTVVPTGNEHKFGALPRALAAAPNRRRRGPRRAQSVAVECQLRLRHSCTPPQKLLTIASIEY